MKYSEFENIMSTTRMRRYLAACNNNSKRAMTLYRKNLQLSQELFTIISCFEIALRNSIDQHYLTIHGNNWLRQAASNGGMFDNQRCRLTADNINEAIQKLN
ncbi:MAG: CAAX protease, partial [Flammeovirgaceae bacterium]